MKHTFLGEVELSDGNPFDAKAKVQLCGQDVRLGIMCDGETLDNVLNRAAEIVRRLPDLDEAAKRVAATKGLLEMYNDGWNEYDEAQEDGTWKTVVNPQLSEAEFIAKLSLNAVNVTGDQMITLFYDDEGMFWGHSVVVTSFQDIDLTNAHAEIFG